MMNVGSKTSFLQKAYESQHFSSLFRTSDSKVSPDHAENVSQQNIWHVESEKKKSSSSKPSRSILAKIHKNQSLKTNTRRKCTAFDKAACCSKKAIPLMIGLTIGSLIGGIILGAVSTAWAQSCKTYLILFFLKILSKNVKL